MIRQMQAEEGVRWEHWFWTNAMEPNFKNMIVWNKTTEEWCNGNCKFMRL